MPKPPGLPGDDLEGLVERAEAAGQHTEGIGQRAHAHLAEVHGGHHLQFGDRLVADLLDHEVLGDDADDPAAGGQRRVGQRAHQADPAAAEDDADAAFGGQAAELGRGLDVAALGAPRGAAVDAEVLELGHIVSPSRPGAVAPERSCFS